ncbi:hypothetical protein BT96DRAFT_1005933 [Gymnopus androsaceus JB14]|uniref:WD40 repeat-like protein n=1 Tax=Gymnopus androsaceus JB14 TaxID=1447944 RepID=A0A6A4GM95_9AGAR|nr:hypothetical protein BT96DRAFT_1005933 [Gymnopus androsaceus JB14]
MISEWRESLSLQLSTLQTQGHKVKAVSLSPNSQWLAIGVEFAIYIWDMKQSITVRNFAFRFRGSTDMVSMRWTADSPDTPDVGTYLVCTHKDARIYTAVLTDVGYVGGGFRPVGAHSTALMSTTLSDRLIAVAYTDAVRILRFRIDEFQNIVWDNLGSLPRPPAAEDYLVENLAIQSVHSLSINSLLVSYGIPGGANTLVFTWRIKSLIPFNAEVQGVNQVSGFISDVSRKLNAILVTDTMDGAYKLYESGSSFHRRVYTPRFQNALGQRTVAQPVSSALFLDKDSILGTGVGQLVLWREDSNTLQNLVFRNHPTGVVESFSSAYDGTIDVGWIVCLINFPDRAEVILWHTVDINEEQLPVYLYILKTLHAHLLLIASTALAVAAYTVYLTLVQ